jgi:putative aldouronate transport system permease protein
MKSEAYMRCRKNTFIYDLMMLPGVVFLLIFSIVPMFGIIIAFQKFIPTLGFFRSKWVGMDNFVYIFQVPDSLQVISNTLYIAIFKIIAGLVVPVIFALLLNEVRMRWFKRSVQTIVYMPNFLSWVILGGILKTMLASDGIINHLFVSIGIIQDPIQFLGSNVWFRTILIITDTWKNYGFGAIIYLAALAGIDPALYEAAVVDGAGRWRQIWHITFPGIMTTCVLLATLSLGNILNAGFDQIFNMYNPLVYQTADIIDTYVYRLGLVSMQFSMATAIGVTKSLVSLILIVLSYYIAAKTTKYRIF